VTPHDWDITTDATPDIILKMFDHTVATGEKHGTITVIIDGESFEITTFRGDGAYSDGRHPDSVTFVSSIEEDLKRRDFTVNAIAYDPLTWRFVDPHQGIVDLHNGIIRCVGNPVHRFTEDGLRVLRALRFRATLDCGQIEENTEKAISLCLDSYSKVAKERVHDEWVKIMRTQRPSRAFEVMLSTGVLKAEVPEMLHMVGCAQNRYHGFDVWNHSLAVMDHCPADDPTLRIAALLHDIGKPITKGVNPRTGDATFYEHDVVGADMAKPLLVGMKFSNEEVEAITHLIRHHYIRYEKGNSKASIRRWVRKVGVPYLPRLFTLGRADILGKGPAMVKLELDTIEELRAKVSTMQVEEVLPTSTKVLKVDGRDVMQALGIKPGPEVGKVLDQLLEMVTDDPGLNTRENLLWQLVSMKVEVKS
jgi:tRNA nucleotidyltransferase (CCA-adding enzyme)